MGRILPDSFPNLEYASHFSIVVSSNVAQTCIYFLDTFIGRGHWCDGGLYGEKAILDTSHYFYVAKGYGQGGILYLPELIAWLMVAPVGLKLSSVLNSARGKFFLYHIHLWVFHPLFRH